MRDGKAFPKMPIPPMISAVIIKIGGTASAFTDPRTARVIRTITMKISAPHKAARIFS